jgi:hypothetical protein
VRVGAWRRFGAVSISSTSEQVECRTYGARIRCLNSQPFRAGLCLAGGPPGLEELSGRTVPPGFLSVRESSGPQAFAWRIAGLKSETWGTHHLIQEVLTQTLKAITGTGSVWHG